MQNYLDKLFYDYNYTWKDFHESEDEKEMLDYQKWLLVK